MRILDKNNIELKEIDFNKGYLIEEELVKKHHEAIEPIEEQGHYEIVKEYPNGGKDVKWIVDIPGVEPQDAYDEIESIQRFIPFTKEELNQHRILELKGCLANTDYEILKVVEGATTLQAIAETIKQRALWRKEINELEKALNEN